MKAIKIGNRVIGPDHPPTIIAEMSGNHNGSLQRALEIVDAAAKTGAHGLKLQTYTADTMTLNLATGDFFISDPKSPWKGRSLYDLYEEAHTPWEWHAPIKERCDAHGMFFLSTPFDDTAVDFLEGLNVPCYKIASFENTDIPLLKKVAATGKPLIVSTGMASIAELEDLVTTVRQHGCHDLILLKCTSSYPSTPENSDIRTIPHLRDLFNVEVGLSDHTLGIGVAVASVAMGCSLIEKHFTLDRADGGVDSAFSMEPAEMKALVIESERAWQSLGKISYGTKAIEEKSKQFRRSIYITENVRAGDVVSTKNIRCIRPGSGLKPRHLEAVLGRVFKQDLSLGTPLSWDVLT